MAVLEVKELSKKYPKAEKFAADKVSFSVEEGDIFALIGSNGAGKTTTIRMIATLLSPTSGDAVVNGNSILSEPICETAYSISIFFKLAIPLCLNIRITEDICKLFI